MATIQKRKWKTKTTFRALVRRKGFKDLHKSFNTRADAQVWARDIERNLDRGLATDYSEASKHTLKDILKRYIKEEKGKHKKYPWVEGLILK